MNGGRQVWLVAVREIRERIRSRAFRASLVAMILIVVGVIIVPAMLDTGGSTKDVGLTGSISNELPRAIKEQSDAAGTTARVHRFNSLAAGKAAVRDGDIDVLVIDAERLVWRRQADEQLRAVVTGAIQLVAVGERAADAASTPTTSSPLSPRFPSRTSSWARWPGAAPTTRQPPSS